MEKKNKKNIWFIVGIILAVVGVIIILSAIYMNFKGKLENDKMISNFEKKLEQVKDNNEKVEIKEQQDVIEEGTIGIMQIPKIGLKVAVGEGTDMETLKYAVGHFKDTALPGELGNFAVAGHRSYTYNEFFNRLDEVTTGDKILVKTLKGTFTYEVTGTEVVEPTQVEVLNKTDNATVTLVTCTPIRTATHRLIIKGVLVNN
ncbi:sortase [Clostridium cellulovorans]|uniref:Sortase family protein n=1 Tax=Clostridium cellulovorans (strain ATCC 35296 / DSM 3052 / OCM 3 / 743B) TaxID=573061 RepID=D9SNP6_CLOC7|nr:sortase [Clostridium cellulovorans]ADL49917.1 sortase family protein [Clostridium cellulovorans 743B]